jgi:hypothetical protein
VAWLCYADCEQPWEQMSFSRRVQACEVLWKRQFWIPRPATGISWIVMSPCQPSIRLNRNYDIVACVDGGWARLCNAMARIAEIVVESNSETLSEEVSCSVLRFPSSFLLGPSSYRDRGWDAMRWRLRPGLLDTAE